MTPAADIVNAGTQIFRAATFSSDVTARNHCMITTYGSWNPVIFITRSGS